MKKGAKLYVMLTQVDGQEFLESFDDIYSTRTEAAAAAKLARAGTPKDLGEKFRVACFQEVQKCKS